MWIFFLLFQNINLDISTVEQLIYIFHKKKKKKFPIKTFLYIKKKKKKQSIMVLLFIKSYCPNDVDHGVDNGCGFCK